MDATLSSSAVTGEHHQLLHRYCQPLLYIVVAASKGSKTLLLLVVIIGLMLTSAVAKGGRGFVGSRAAGTGGGSRGNATTGGRTSASVTWGPTSTFWLLLSSFIFLMV
ncbi:hypothetical protein IMY05_001G0004900 [Salix suchowensis]|nr:hypothetical protein IMY05_001G0004900 [Salix suchowensis]